MRYQDIGSMFFRFVTMDACDGQKDRQNYYPQDRASIAASPCKSRTVVTKEDKWR